MTRLEQLEELEKAKKLWEESEWRLNFLRSETGTPTPAEPTDEEIVKWHEDNQQTLSCMIN